MFFFLFFSFPFHSVKWVDLLSLHSPKSSTREFLKFPPHFGNGSLWCVTKVTHELLCYFFFQLKNGDSDTYIYQGDLMGPNPAHSTHSDQQSVDLYDYINQRNWSKIFINALAIKKYIYIKRSYQDLTCWTVLFKLWEKAREKSSNTFIYFFPFSLKCEEQKLK